MTRPRTKLYFLQDENVLVTGSGEIIEDVVELSCSIGPRGSEWHVQFRDIEMVRESTYTDPKVIADTRAKLENLEKDLEAD